MEMSREIINDKNTMELLKELKKRAPVSQNEIAGWVYYMINNYPVCKYPIYTENCTKPDWALVISKVSWKCLLRTSNMPWAKPQSKYNVAINRKGIR